MSEQDNKSKKEKKAKRSKAEKQIIAEAAPVQRKIVHGHRHAPKLSPTARIDRMVRLLNDQDALEKEINILSAAIDAQTNPTRNMLAIENRLIAKDKLIPIQREIKRLYSLGTIVNRYRIPQYPAYKCVGKGARVRTMYAVEQDGWDNIEGHKVAHYDEFLFCPTKATWQDISSTEEALVFVDAPEARRSMIEQTREWVKASPHAPQQLTIVTRVDNRIALRTASLRGIVAIAPVGEKEVSE